MQTIFGADETSPDKKTRDRVISGLCVGALSGAITSAAALAADSGLWALRLMAMPFLLGSVFGAVFAIWFWIGMEKRSVSKALGFTVACAAAYIAASFSSVFSVGLFGGLDLNNDSRMIAGSPPGSFFIGGTVGAFIVLAAALFLFSDEGKPLRMLSRAMAYSPLGGAFGLAAWGACSLLDPEKPSGSGNGVLELMLLWLLWQSGMGALLGNLCVPENRPAPLPTPVAKRGALGINVARVVLVSICLAGVVYFVVPDIPSEIQAARWQSAYKKHLSEKPPLQTATAVQPRPVNQILILRSFGEYLPGTGKVTLGNAFPDPDSHKASELRPQWYTIRYQLQDESQFSPKPYIDVAILEFPSAAWAKFEMEELSSGLRAEEFSSRPSAQVRVLSNKGIPNAGDHERFVWYSGSYMLDLQSNFADADEVLRAYLEKYPSAL